jgi:excisionase family DNA binding protein
MRLISVNEAADRLSLSPLTIRRLIKRGELPHARPTARTVRIPECAVMTLATPQTKGAREG